MADAPSGGSSWGTLEIVLVAILAIGFLTQLQNGFKSTPETTTPSKADPVTSVVEKPCGLVISRPSLSEKVGSFVSVTGRVEGCEWHATESVALYAQVIDSAGRPLSAYTPVAPLNGQYEVASFDTTVALTAVPTTTKGFLIFAPARNVGSQTTSHRIPLTFSRN